MTGIDKTGCFKLLALGVSVVLFSSIALCRPVCSLPTEKEGVSVANGRIEGSATLFRFTTAQKEQIAKDFARVPWCAILKLTPAQSKKLREKTSVSIDEVFLSPPKVDLEGKVEPGRMTTYTNNYAIQIDRDTFEVAHKNLRPGEKFETFKKLLNAPPGSVIHRGRFVPEVF